MFGYSILHDEDTVSAIGRKCQLNAQDCSSHDKNFGGEKDPRAVFNVLDTMLKSSLERLKIMRLAFMSSSLKSILVVIRRKMLHILNPMTLLVITLMLQGKYILGKDRSSWICMSI
jgi:hypothetical protein